MSAPQKNNNLTTYQLLHVAQQDLSQAAFFADHLRLNRWSAEPWEVNWKQYLHQCAYMTAMVTAYCRPFTIARGFPKFPSRLLKLDNEQRELHERLLALRNEVYAHSDIKSRKVRPMSRNGSRTTVEVLPPMRMSEEELMAVRILITHISQAIQERMSVVRPLVSEPL